MSEIKEIIELYEKNTIMKRFVHQSISNHAALIELQHTADFMAFLLEKYHIDPTNRDIEEYIIFYSVT